LLVPPLSVGFKTNKVSVLKVLIQFFVRHLVD
jgi:hypothetical protein